MYFSFEVACMKIVTKEEILKFRVILNFVSNISN